MAGEDQRRQSDPQRRGSASRRGRHSAPAADEVALLQQAAARRAPRPVDVRRSPRPPARSAREEVRRRPVAVAAAERDGEQQQELPVRARPGASGRKARSNLWTRPWTFVNVPSFSASEAAGQDDVGGARQGVGGARARRRGTAPGAGRATFSGSSAIARERRVGDDDDLGRGLARQDGLEAVAARAGREAHVPRAARSWRRAWSPSIQSVLRLDPAHAGLVDDDVAVGAAEVVRELPKEEVLLVREVRRAQEEEPRRARRVDGLRGSPRRCARPPPGTIGVLRPRRRRGPSPCGRRARSGSPRGTGRSRRASSR